MDYVVAITTDDNPYDPITQFDEWYRFDEQEGYCTSGYISRLILTSDNLSESQQALAYEQAVDSIVNLNLTGNYRKIKRRVS